MIIEAAMAQLDHCERQLIWLRFYEQRTQSEIAQIIGTSQMHVSRWLSRLMTKMQVIIGGTRFIGRSRVMQLSAR
jgi:RNA polymerase sigma-B factor